MGGRRVAYVTVGLTTVKWAYTKATESESCPSDNFISASKMWGHRHRTKTGSSSDLANIFEVIFGPGVCLSISFCLHATKGTERRAISETM